jgi:mono/diheme cytochrome c family protein
MKHVRLAASLGAAAVLISASALAQMDPKKVERAWKSKCASCHGADGKGQSEQGKKLGVLDYTSPEWQKAHTDDAIRKGINEGVKGMEGYKDKLSPEQIDSLVQHVRGLK